MSLTGRVPRTLLTNRMLVRWLQDVGAVSLVEYCCDEEWDEWKLVSMRPHELQEVESLQNARETPLRTLMKGLTADVRRAYTRDSVLDSRITQRQPDEGASGLCAWNVAKVLGWLESNNMSSLISLADDDHWSGMVLCNLTAGEQKKIEMA